MLECRDVDIIFLFHPDHLFFFPFCSMYNKRMTSKKFEHCCTFLFHLKMADHTNEECAEAVVPCPFRCVGKGCLTKVRVSMSIIATFAVMSRIHFGQNIECKIVRYA